MNIVTATFSAGCSEIEADRKLWQYDQGQVLQLVGLDLPDAYQVEFSNSRDKGSAKAQIGGPDGVSIPDEYLTTGKPVYAFLVGHTAEEDRETEKLVVIYVNARSQPTDEPITPEQQSIVDQLIAALTAGVEKAEDAAAQAEAAVSYMPKIVDGTWWVYDAETETWADTGIQAEGQDGVGISGAVLNADYTLTLTFTDGSSYTTPPIRGPKGEDAPDDYILVQPTEPTSETNALWINSAAGERVQLPTMADHEALAEDVAANTEAIGDLSDELSDQKSIIEALDSLVDRKAGALIDTASGSVASFVPDATIDNLLGLTVAIEPVQDLHGFDHPWPAGGGKNIMPAPTTIEVNSSGLTVTDSNGKLTINGSAQSGDTIIVRIPETTIGTGYIIALLNSFTGATVYFLNGTTNVDYFSVSTANRVINTSSMSTLYDKPFTAYRILFSVAQTLTNAAFGMMAVLDGADTTTFAPYENICPISGWDAVEVERTGKNLWGGTLANNVNVVFDTKLGQTYTVSAKLKGTNDCYLYLNSSVDGFQTDELVGRILIGQRVATVTFTAEAGKEYALWSNASYKEADKIQIELGSTATDYEPYQGQTYPITFPASAGTVYGGTLDVDAGTLTVDRYYVTLANSARVSYHPEESTPSIWMRYESGKLAKVTGGRAMSNIYRIGGGVAPFIAYYGTEIDIYDARFTDEQTALSLLADFKCVYTLATPIVITLDPVTISTISGQTNNVWADAGDVDMTYAADLKHYIDSKIAAAVAALS